MSMDDADRVLTNVLRDRARIPAPPRLHRKLARRFAPQPRRWLAPLASALAAAALTAVVMLALRPAPPSTDDAAVEAAGDHVRMLVGRGLGVAASDMHQVKPWFTGKLEFVPPIAFLGDTEFPLAGGDVAVFRGRRAAQLVYHRRLHVISLLVFEGDAPDDERDVHGFHTITWSRDGFGFALVSDVNYGDLRTLRDRIRLPER